VIPRIVPPLTGTTILVTRPQPQATELANAIANWGGESIVFPTIAIEPLAVEPLAVESMAAGKPEAFDLVIFVSVHAVAHGAHLIERGPSTRIAAIGKATAAALSAVNLPAEIVPQAGFTSEALLAQPNLQMTTGQRVLIVRGAGGREMLRESLSAQGSIVNTLEVYRRVKPSIAADTAASLELRWFEDGIDAVTATSVETYTNLTELISPRARTLLNGTALIAPSRRIIDAARETGWNAEGLVAGSAEDAAILGTLARWRTRARGS
jgi:uroporphyrinogen-III synthase